MEEENRKRKREEGFYQDTKRARNENKQIGEEKRGGEEEDSFLVHWTFFLFLFLLSFSPFFFLVQEFVIFSFEFTILIFISIEKNRKYLKIVCKKVLKKFLPKNWKWFILKSKKKSKKKEKKNILFILSTLLWIGFFSLSLFLFFFFSLFFFVTFFLLSKGWRNSSLCCCEKWT